MEANNQNRETVPTLQKEQGGIAAGILFGGNGHLAFVYKKTEKLAAAVYLITDFIKDSEPLKWKVRESALALLSLNISFATASHAERRSLAREYHSLALEIVSLSSVAERAGLISEMNFSILSREFDALVSNLEKGDGKKALEETVVLDPGFFAADEPKGQPSRTEVLPPRAHEHLQAAPIKDMTFIQPKPARAVEPKDGKESRRGAIIKLLSKKGGLSIKDFADSIKGVSEKTIQRELLAMVAAGLLKKEGERRWSTYSLA